VSTIDAVAAKRTTEQCYSISTYITRLHNFLSFCKHWGGKTCYVRKHDGSVCGVACLICISRALRAYLPA
jgi:hypothetical protein